MNQARFVQFILLGVLTIFSSFTYAQEVIEVNNQPNSPIILNNIPLNLKNPAPHIASPNWIAVDFDSKTIIGGRNIDAKIYPASMTKVLTAYIIFEALENGRLSKDQKVSTVKNIEGSTMFLNDNDQVSINDLMWGMIVQSGNDASINLALALSGTEERFAEEMNKAAQKLGMQNSHFVNASGLPDDNHYTTLYDMAVLAIALIRDFPQYYPIYSEKTYTYNKVTQNNRNALLFRDIGVDGIKTGHTNAAGFCLMTSVIRGERRIISITAKAKTEKDRFTDNEKIINYVYNQTENVKLYNAREIVDSLRVWKGDQDYIKIGVDSPLFITLAKGQKNDLNAQISYQQPIISPIASGDKIAIVKISLGQRQYAKYYLVSLENVENAAWFRMLWHNILLLFNSK